MGDRALLVELGDDINIKVNNKVRELFVSIKADPLEGVVAVSYTHLTLPTNREV